MGSFKAHYGFSSLLVEKLSMQLCNNKHLMKHLTHVLLVVLYFTISILGLLVDS